MKVPFVRNPYNYDRDRASDDAGLRCDDLSLCKQSFAEEVDINTIVRRFHLTGELPTDVRAPQYVDFEGVFDFHSAMNAVARAGESFDRMPAHVRARFHNSPAEFVDFCSDAANRSEAVKLGLVFDKKELTGGGDGDRIDVRSKEGRDDEKRAVEGDSKGVKDSPGVGKGGREGKASVDAKGE